ncbi:MAG: hypothetical protein AB7S38_15820 [Vulcanimicrobiota bacterium]
MIRSTYSAHGIHSRRATAEAKQYMVKRTFLGPDMGPMGQESYSRYVKTDSPNPGETLYHGAFEKKFDYGDQKYDQPVAYYVPVDPEKITTSVFEGPARADSTVELF